MKQVYIGALGAVLGSVLIAILSVLSDGAIIKLLGGVTKDELQHLDYQLVNVTSHTVENLKSTDAPRYIAKSDICILMHVKYQLNGSIGDGMCKLSNDKGIWSLYQTRNGNGDIACSFMCFDISVLLQE